VEFVVNESGCRQLSQDMLSHMREIGTLISEIESQNGTLRVALGEDYDAIARSVNLMKQELENARTEMNVIINDMNEYMARVHQARIALE